MAQEAGLPITNTLFPPPPPYFQAFAEEALDRYRALTGDSSFLAPTASTSTAEQGSGIAKDDNGDLQVDSVPVERMLDESEENEKRELEGKLGRPRADWINEDGRWMCFGSMYTTVPKIPTAEDIGLPPFIDPSESPSKSLPPLLHSFLHTLLMLLDALSMTARTPDELSASGWAHEGDQYIQHLTNLTANMMVASNQLRAAQSEATLVLLMEKELEERKNQTERLRSKCKEIAGGIKALKELRGAKDV
ncbi:hypothetical protein L202_04973 [Cryptococcus amylolentus CBS 6039]|uniref:Mediator of RNA polymerase II transcription subunit 7 n=1 Tax=Cryptococcus amylolentus CBS 6039 TaxID=1295533 RepID=A0A1E3HND4_9TREE|nr:hypothetical protein L202_04973 [Cryptococcus amylolentus CBS 6039]ODN77859.1 hypothetical protein L202_04973 [Cryptococcus amylolentus CBS 6039]